jgi:cyanate permease
VGVLHQVQGDWHGVLIFLILVTIPAFVGGIVLGRNRSIDDELNQRRLAERKGIS